MITDIFIAYSHEDLAYKNELKKFLRPLLREERISIWDDYDIEAGQEWDAKIKERLYAAGIILLLVSSDSLASDYFYGKEVKVSLERHAKGEAVVVPVILRHCDWENTPLGGLEALPEKGRPVVEWPTQDQAWQDTVSRLRRVLESLEKKRATESARAETQRRYQAAVAAAAQLYERRHWAEARTACADALTLYQPGFSPEKSTIENQLADCNRQLRAETEAREVEARRQQAEAEAEKRRLRAEARQSGGGTLKARPLLLGIFGGLALLFVVWLAFGRDGRKPDSQKQPDPTESLIQLEAASYQKALDAKTIPALQAYLKRYPTGKNAALARQALGDLKTQLNHHFFDAFELLDGNMPDACIKQLDQALLLDPGNTAATNARALVQERKYRQAMVVLKRLGE